MNTRTNTRRNRNFRTAYKPQNNINSLRRFQKRNYPVKQNRRYVPKIRRNRLQRVQNILGVNRINRKYQQSMLKQNYNNFALTNGNINKNSNSKREVYIKGLPRYIDNKGLFNLFKNEGRILHYNILYDSVGFSKGVGKIEFADFRDALNVINKWNNSTYKGFSLKVEYKKMKNGKNENANNSQNQFAKNHTFSNGFSNFQNYSRSFYGNGYKNYKNYYYNYRYQRAYY